MEKNTLFEFFGSGGATPPLFCSGDLDKYSWYMMRELV